MKAFVTGGTGFVGGHLLERLRLDSVETWALARPSSDRQIIQALGVQEVSGDLSAIDQMTRAILNVDTVFHLAGRVSGVREQDFLRENVEGSLSLLEACQRAFDRDGKRRRFIFVSSLAAGGPSEDSRPKKEGDPDSPVSFYGQSKLRAERELLAKRGSAVDLWIARPPVVYGPRDRGVFEIYKLARSRFGLYPQASNPGGEKFYSMIHVLDLVDALVLMARAQVQADPPLYYVSGDEMLGFSEMIQVIEEDSKALRLRLPVPPVALKALKLGLKVLGGRMPLVGGGRLSLDKIKELEPDFWICSNERLKAEIGFRPKFPLREGIQSTLKWYQEAGWL